jgi:hypothetical protein
MMMMRKKKKKKKKKKIVVCPSGASDCGGTLRHLAASFLTPLHIILSNRPQSIV